MYVLNIMEKYRRKKYKWVMWYRGHNQRGHQVSPKSCISARALKFVLDLVNINFPRSHSTQQKYWKLCFTMDRLYTAYSLVAEAFLVMTMTI